MQTIVHFHFLCVEVAPGGVWFPPWTDVSWDPARAISLRSITLRYITPPYITPWIAVTCSGGEGSHSKPDSIISRRTTQTARWPHPADNFCQILLARQETGDGEGQWSRRGRRSLRRSKSSGLASGSLLLASGSLLLASGSLLQPSENWMWVGGTNMKSSATIKRWFDFKS